MRRDFQSFLGELAKTPVRLGASYARPLTRALALLLCLAIALGPASALADALKVGPFTLHPSASVTLGYDSNVDDAYPEEVDPNYRKDDFYVKPGITLVADTLHLRPATTVDLSATWAYDKYFERTDLDTDTYNLSAVFNTTLRYLTLNGGVTAERKTEHDQDDTYYPGGTSRDPYNTFDANIKAMLTLRKLRLEAGEEYNRETHDLERFKDASQVEITTTAGTYYDFTDWMNAFYTYERVYTEYLETDEESTTDVTHEVGIGGTVPKSILRRPDVSWSAGMTKEEKDGEDDAEWEPAFTLAASDTYQLAKYLTLAWNVSWDSEEDDDDEDVGFTYGATLTHVWGPYITQTASYEREPLDTMGSTVDTDTTTYSYTLSIANFFLKGVTAAYGFTYEIAKPQDGESETERTTTHDFSLTHSRQLTKRLSRTMGYTYKWENSNFHHDGANEKHLVEYMLNYAF